jgi:uncharacterized phiE125 gp8 family phage protein
MTALSSSLAWDRGVTWFTRRTVSPSDLPISLEFIRDQHLRVMNDSAEDEWITNAIRSAAQQAEEHTQRALVRQTWQQVVSGFPCSGQIVLERPPLIAVSSVAYYDGDNALQELAGSPTGIEVVPSGAYSKAIVRPLVGTSFPSTYSRPDAVTVTFTAGYTDDESPELSMINQGIALMVGEMYKLRSLSVQEPNNTPALLQIERFWRRVW